MENNNLKQMYRLQTQDEYNSMSHPLADQLRNIGIPLDIPESLPISIRNDICGHTIKLFNFKDFQFRAIIFNNDPCGNLWFINKEICDYLGHSNSRQAIKDANLLDFEITHVEICDVSNTYVTSRARHTQNMTVISESGLYKLIGNSRKPEARDFQNWVYNVVIPSIRRYGAYIEPNTRGQLDNNPNLIHDLNNKISDYENQIAKLNNQISDMEPYASTGEFMVNNMGLIPIESLAKLLNSSGIDIGRNRLFKLLRNEGFLMKIGNNRPTQKSLDMGVMVFNNTILPNGNVYTSVYITPKGINYFINKYKDLK